MVLPQSKKVGREPRTPVCTRETLRDAEILKLRNDFQKVIEKLTWKGFRTLCEINSVTFLSKPDTIRKFQRTSNETVTLEHDAATLRRFLYGNETTKAILEGTLSEQTFTQSLSHCSQLPKEHSDIPLPQGLFKVYHGSYMIEDHFVVRVIRIAASPIGQAMLYDKLNANKTGNEGLINAPGMLIYKNGMPQLVAMHADNAIGLVVFAADSFRAEAGKLTRMIGYMQGLNYNRQQFSRATLIERISGDSPEEEEAALKTTGIRLMNEWDAGIQDRFRFLAENLPKQQFVDPMIDYAKAVKGGQLTVYQTL